MKKGNEKFVGKSFLIKMLDYNKTSILRCNKSIYIWMDLDVKTYFLTLYKFDFYKTETKLTPMIYQHNLINS